MYLFFDFCLFRVFVVLRPIRYHASNSISRATGVSCGVQRCVLTVELIEFTADAFEAFFNKYIPGIHRYDDCTASNSAVLYAQII